MYAPIEFPTLNPFTIQFSNFDNKILASHQNQNNLSINIQNSSYAVKEIGNSQKLILDGEIVQLSVNYYRKVSDVLGFEIKVPFYSLNKGFLDNSINQWHDLLGLSDGSRIYFENNQLQFSLEDETRIFLIKDSYSGVGDIQISSKYNFFNLKDNRFYLISTIDLPSGSKNKKFGNNIIDGRISFNLKNNKIDNVVINSLLGISLFNEKNNSFLKEENLTLFTKLLVSWKPEYFLSEKISNPLVYKFNLEIFEPFYKSNLEALGDIYYLIGLGASYEYAKNKYFSFGFSEDLKVNSSADFSFVFGFDFKL